MALVSYSEALLEAHQYLLKTDPSVFIIGQGVTSPWYVGNTLKELDLLFGKDRVMDTPISEEAVAGLAIGASLCGYRPILVYPRFDFMLLSMSSIVNQAAKWGYIFGGIRYPKLTIRAILNRGAEQGAQHSQAFHSWFMNVPGLRVVMPTTPMDARDLLISSVQCPDPVLFIEDRWLYEREQVWRPITELNLAEEKSLRICTGTDLTLVGAGFSADLCRQAAELLWRSGISAEVIDLRILNPLDITTVLRSVKKTKRLLVVDGGWRACGLGGEIIASVLETLPLNLLQSQPVRITLPDCPAPSARALEDVYYPTPVRIVKAAKRILNRKDFRKTQYVETPI